ncbi:MAG: YCF48-related protein [Burkholderiaceae bacterium]
MVEQVAKEEGGFAKLLNFVTSLLPIVIIGGLLYAGFFVKGTTDIKKVEPKAVERRDNFYSIIAPTDQVAWAVGTGGKIIRSEDGGKSWTRQQTSTIENLQGIAAWDAQTAVAVGNRGLAFHTADGGKTWRPSSVPKSDNPNKLLRVSIFDGVAWAVGEFGGFFRSDDKGATFTRVLPEKDSALNAVFFNGKNGILVGEFGSMLKSADGGATWTDSPVENKVSLMSIAFSTESEGVAVGLAGTLMTTADGGATWTLVPPLTREHLFSVIWDTNRWVVVGDKGVMLTAEAGAKDWKLGKVFEGDIAWRTQIVKGGSRYYVAGANLGILEDGKLTIVGR